ncbi:MAG: mercuric transporter MerT family protein [Gemmatimonadota bacterium]
MLRTGMAVAGGVAAAVGSALCCAGPMIAVGAGVSGAGLVAFEPFRPYFLGGTAALLAFGFYTVHREEKAACDADQPCADPGVRRRTKLMLWAATVVAIVFATFPSWQSLLF